MNKQNQKKLRNEEMRKTAEVQAERADKSAQESAKPFATSTRRAFSAVRKGNTNLFVSIKKAYDALFVPEVASNSEELLAWQHYRLEVLTFCDRSSFNKIVSICENDLIMTNLDRLPVAWSTLAKIDCLLKTDDDGESFIALLDSNEINVTSTASNVVALLTPETEEEEVAPSSSDPIISYDSSLYSEEQLIEIEEALKTLESYGFVIEDVAEVSDEVSDEEANASSDDQAEAA
jgi:hypothetical protein